MTRLVEDPVLKQRYRFERTGDVVRVEAWVAPGGGVTPHRHPRMEERFDVLAGEITFTLGRRKVLARAGESVVVPAGARHAYRNTGAVEAHMVTDAEPALELQEFLEAVAALSLARRINRFGMPTGPRAAVEAAVVAARYRETVELDFPPWFAVAALARFGSSRTTGHSTAIR
jgi:mannose-6-phosphate isomerase-like protein (cupin superfamily)